MPIAIPCYPTFTRKPEASAIESLMMLAEISTISSNDDRKSSSLVQTTSSRCSIPSIVSDDNANLTKSNGTTNILVSTPNVPPIKFDENFEECNNITMDSVAYEKESYMFSIGPSAEDSRRRSATFDDTFSSSFLSNELLSTKFKRPKGRVRRKNPSLGVSSSCSRGYEKNNPEAQLEENLIKDISVPQVSKNAKKIMDKIKLKSSVEYDKSEVKFADGVKVLVEDMKKSSSLGFPKTTDAITNRSLFPMKLYDLLNNKEIDPQIISWDKSGKSFQILNVDKLTEIILPRVFNHTSLSSFQRQLNLYVSKQKFNRLIKSIFHNTNKTSFLGV